MLIIHGVSKYNITQKNFIKSKNLIKKKYTIYKKVMKLSLHI